MSDFRSYPSDRSRSELNGRRNYIHLYHGNAALLTESLEVIQKAAAVILSALENPVTEEPTTEPEVGGQPKDN